MRRVGIVAVAALVLVGLVLPPAGAVVLWSAGNQTASSAGISPGSSASNPPTGDGCWVRYDPGDGDGNPSGSTYWGNFGQSTEATCQSYYASQLHDGDSGARFNGPAVTTTTTTTAATTTTAPTTTTTAATTTTTAPTTTTTAPTTTTTSPPTTTTTAPDTQLSVAQQTRDTTALGFGLLAFCGFALVATFVGRS